ncbi:hypothetical protein U1Q18_038069, partial [Sarracenia purpurea var. burkii]
TTEGVEEDGRRIKSEDGPSSSDPPRRRRIGHQRFAIPKSLHSYRVYKTLGLPSETSRFNSMPSEEEKLAVTPTSPTSRFIDSQGTEEGSETNSEESVHKDSIEEVGKWASESRDPVDRVRIRWGTSFSAEEAYGVYLVKKFELQAKAMVVPKRKDEPSSVSPLKSECSGSATDGGSDIGNATPTLKDNGGELGNSGSGLGLIID